MSNRSLKSTRNYGMLRGTEVLACRRHYVHLRGLDTQISVREGGHVVFNRRGILFPRHSFLLLICSLTVLIAASTETLAQTTQKKKALLATIKRIVVVPPFFGTETIAKADAEAKAEKEPAENGKEPRKANPKLAEYAEQLRKLEARARIQLPERVAARTPYTVVPAQELADALKELKLKPENLFENKGLIKNRKFAAPDIANITKLATALHADAVLLGTMDEPRRDGDKLIYDIFSGINFSPGHVLCKAGYYTVLVDGTIAYSQPIGVVQPTSKVGNRVFVLADWLDGTDLAIETYMDELTRYTPVRE